MRRTLTLNAFPALVLLLAPVAAAMAQPGDSPGPSAGTADGESAGPTFHQENRQAILTWPAGSGNTARAIFSLDESQPLIRSLILTETGATGPSLPIAENLQPVTLLTVGERNLNTPAGWVAFFDNPPRRPWQVFPVTSGRRRAEFRSHHAAAASPASGAAPASTRATVILADAAAGSFSGDIRVTVYPGSPLLHLETVLSTRENGRAIFYDTGLSTAHPAGAWQSLHWHEPGAVPVLRSAPLDPSAPAEPLAVAGRTLAAQGPGGSLAVFPAPHQFFYPQDEAFNLKFVWHGRGYGGKTAEWGFGIRQSPTGDNRYVPWFNAPPGTAQHLGVFWLLSRRPAPEALETVASYTRGDRFKPLPGHRTFTSHFHVEHTQEFLRGQQEQGTTGIPRGLEVPGFVTTFKARGVDIAHMAEFHYKDGARTPEETRLRELRTLHEECARLSDAELLVLPGEEPNIQLGGHWISLFPKPVYWTLNRSANAPFREDVPGYGTVYRMGSPAEVLTILEQEGGLMWTAHPRIKGSIGYPDKYRSHPFFRSPHFLGGAWKAMPADLSWSTLGPRVLELQDDMANWGLRKHTPGEVDTFRMEPHFETWAHMNINYLRLDRLPRFYDGWQPVVDALRHGRFFTSTGEVLIPSFAIGGRQSGETLILPESGATELEAQLEWTFPLAFAEIVSGDGHEVFRQRLPLTGTTEHGRRTVKIPLALKGRTWVRFEVWDIAANGAYTQPVWLEGPGSGTATGGEIPQTWARFVPERKDDFAWENDLAAFRVYGPAIRPPGTAFRPGMEDSGIDCWTKRVPYPVISKWYSGERHTVSYHEDHGEGCDLYSVGSSRGCGGTALWLDGRMILSGPFREWKILSRTPERTSFELVYQYDLPDGPPVREVKHITIGKGHRLFRSESTFTREGRPATGLEVAIGITTHEGKATATLAPDQGWMACWERIEGSGLGTGVVMDPSAIRAMRLHTTPGTLEEHALILTQTDASGKTVHHAGSGWERAGDITTAELWHAALSAGDSRVP